MNYKLLFWILFSLTIGMLIYFWVNKMSLEVDLSIREWHIDYLESDIYTIDAIIKSNGSEKKIDSILNEYLVSDYYTKVGDTTFLNRAFIVLKNDSITRIGVKK